MRWNFQGDISSSAFISFESADMMPEFRNVRNECMHLQVKKVKECEDRYIGRWDPTQHEDKLVARNRTPTSKATCVAIQDSVARPSMIEPMKSLESSTRPLSAADFVP